MSPSYAHSDEKMIPTPLVTGNGFGFAVLSAEDGVLTKFYTHPYKFEKSDIRNPLSEGIETSNLVNSIEWYHKGVPEVEYIKQSNIIRLKASETQEESCFMPFDLPFNVLILSKKNQANAGSQLNINWSHKVITHKLGNFARRSFIVMKFAGLKETVLLIPLRLSGKPNIRTSDYQNGEKFSRLKNFDGWAIATVDSERQVESVVSKFDKWDSARDYDELVRRELVSFEKWRVKEPGELSENESKLWRQSEAVLRMAQSREPNVSGRYGNGLILASLPDGAWFVPWVRDMVYATLAFSRMGHKDEAERAIDSLFNARPVSKMQKELGNLPYQISVVRYFGNGEEEPFFTMEGATNIELDDWGLVLWLLGEHLNLYPQSDLLEHKTYRGTIYESAKNFVLKPLLANLEPYEGGLIVKADTSIWEERQQNKKHFAFSTIMAIKGLQAFQRLAERKNDVQLQHVLAEKINLLKKGFMAAFIKDNALRGALEPGIKNEVDGAMLTAITLGIVEDEQTVKRTMENMETLKMPSGGYRRVTSIETDPKVFEYWYERQEFLFIDFLVAEILLQQGERAKVEKIVQSIAKKAAEDHFFVPEMYVSHLNNRFRGPLGSPTGAVPMVGYGAGVFELFTLLKTRINGVGKAEFF